MLAIKHKLSIIVLAATLLVGLAPVLAGTSLAVAPDKNGNCPSGYYKRDQDNSCVKSSDADKAAAKAQADANAHQCGGTDNGNTPVTTSIALGCQGKGNPITDLAFAIIRLLSDGVGLVVVGSIIVAGIQYTASRADPQAIAAAQQRIRSSIIALIIYIFAYAILNYVIPNGFLLKS